MSNQSVRITDLTLPDFTWSQIFCSLSLLLFTKLTYNWYFQPKTKLSFYSKQGIVTRYRFLFGMFAEWQQDDKIGDILKTRKQELTVNPNLDVVAYNLVNGVHMILLDPALIRQFYVDKERYYIKNQDFVRNIKRLLGSGMAFSEGQVWKHKRTIISKVFNYNFLLQLLPTVTAIVNDVLARLPVGEYFNLINQSQMITAEVVIQTFFTTKFQGIQFEGKPISEALDEMIKELQLQGLTLPSFLFGTQFFEWGLLPSHRRLIRKINAFKRFGLQVIDNRIKEVSSTGYQPSQQKDLIETLIENKTLESNDQRSSEDLITRQELLDEFATFYVGGTDTTGHLIAYVLYILAKEPYWQGLVREQIQQFIKSDADINQETIKQLNILSNVIQETLRFIGPGTGIFFRTAQEDHQLGNYWIKKGTWVQVGIVENFFNPRIFTNPHKFDPTRWEVRDLEKGDPYEFLPFSAGKRNCIGQHMALLETKITVIQILRKFNKISLPENCNPQWTQKFMYEPKEPLLLKGEC